MEYETWLVAETGEPINKVSAFSQEELDTILEEHPEYTLRAIPCGCGSALDYAEQHFGW